MTFESLHRAPSFLRLSGALKCYSTYHASFAIKLKHCVLCQMLTGSAAVPMLPLYQATAHSCSAQPVMPTVAAYDTWMHMLRG